MRNPTWNQWDNIQADLSKKRLTNGTVSVGSIPAGDPKPYAHEWVEWSGSEQKKFLGLLDKGT